jgi:hypothetical protein
MVRPKIVPWKSLAKGIELLVEEVALQNKIFIMQFKNLLLGGKC